MSLLDDSGATITGADGSPPPPAPASSAQPEEFTTLEPDSPPPPPPPSLETEEQPDDQDLVSPPPVLEENFEDGTSLAPPPILMDADLPLLDGSLTPSDCCTMKKVGDFSYSLLGEDTLDWRLGCKNGCVYVRENLPGRRFCFREGNMSPQCF